MSIAFFLAAQILAPAPAAPPARPPAAPSNDVLLAQLRRAVLTLRQEAEAQRQADGGTLTPDHRKAFDRRLMAIEARFRALGGVLPR